MSKIAEWMCPLCHSRLIEPQSGKLVCPNRSREKACTWTGPKDLRWYTIDRSNI